MPVCRPLNSNSETDIAVPPAGHGQQARSEKWKPEQNRQLDFLQTRCDRVAEGYVDHSGYACDRGSADSRATRAARSIATFWGPS